MSQSLPEENLAHFLDGLGSDPYQLGELKCTKCNCTNFYNLDDERYAFILEQGYRMRIRIHACLDAECYCHTHSGKPVRILHRITEPGKVING